MKEFADAHGVYEMTIIGPDGRIKWHGTFDNVVTTLGKNAALNAYLNGSAYNATCYLGLIAGSSFSAVAATDTMSSHPGWNEYVAYSGSRKTLTWSAASSGSVVATTVSYSITGSGVVQGAFLVFGSGASNAVGNTGGVLYSAGVGSSQPSPSSGDTVNMSYTASI